MQREQRVREQAPTLGVIGRLLEQGSRFAFVPVRRRDPGASDGGARIEPSRTGCRRGVGFVERGGGRGRVTEPRVRPTRADQRDRLDPDAIIYGRERDRVVEPRERGAHIAAHQRGPAHTH